MHGGLELEANIPLRLVREVGTHAVLRTFWGAKHEDGSLNLKACPNYLGLGRAGYFHNAERVIATSSTPEDWSLGGESEDHPDPEWPGACAHCHAWAPAGAKRQLVHRRRWSTPDEALGPGDAFFRLVHPRGTLCPSRWAGCTGEHFFIVLPNGWQWDTSARSTTCTAPRDPFHRCWAPTEPDPDTDVTLTSPRGCADAKGLVRFPGGAIHVESGALVRVRL